MVERTDKSDGCRPAPVLPDAAAGRGPGPLRGPTRPSGRERRRVAALPLTLVTDDATLDQLAGMALDARGTG